MRIAATALFCILSTAIAQKPPQGRSLETLVRAFEAQIDQLYRDGKAPTRDEESALKKSQLAEMEAFVQHEAAGSDLWPARSMLAQMCVQMRQKDRAIASLAAIDAEGAPFSVVLRGAELAAELGDAELRQRLVLRARKAAASVEDRMDLARVLATALRDVAAGEAIHKQELDAAKDDEQRAYVGWLWCKAVREREDLPENSYYDALDQLAKNLPATYWGGVAKDRSTASQFQIGAPCIAFRATALGGAEVRSESQRGRAVALAFCDTQDPLSKELVARLLKIAESDANLAIVVIATDADCKSATRSAEQFGSKALVVCDGKGMDSDLLLRFHVEAAPTVIAIDTKGNIAGLNLHAENKEAQQELDAAIARASAK